MPFYAAQHITGREEKTFSMSQHKYFIGEVLSVLFYSLHYITHDASDHVLYLRKKYYPDREYKDYL